MDGIHFLNTGSVGRPKDGDWRAGYVLLDVTSESVSPEFIRVEYDVQLAAQAIRASSLPSEFADYLISGGKLRQPVDLTVQTTNVTAENR